MNYSIAIQLFDSLDENDQVREIYAHFGRAIYFAQLLEQQAINMIAMSKQINENLNNPEEVEALWENYDEGKRPFGRLINELKKLYSLTKIDLENLNGLLKMRNYMAHNYFRRNSELMITSSGKRRIIKDFVEFCEKAESLDASLKLYQKKYLLKIGLSDQRLEAEVNSWMNDWKNKEIGDDHQTYQ